MKYNDNDVNIKVGSYYNGALYVAFTTKKEGNEEFFSDITKNFNHCFSYLNYIDINNNPGLIEFLEDNNIGTVVENYSIRSGFVEYPLFHFNRDVLHDIDPGGVKSFEDVMNTFFEYSEDDYENNNDDELEL